MFQKFLSEQYRCPTGLVGRLIGQRMAQQHRPENLWTVALLNVQANHHVLEIGFGSGFAIAEVAKLARSGHVDGIDASETMVLEASKHNADAIRAQRVTLQQGDAARLPFSDHTFDKVYGIHTVYFWTHPLVCLQEARRVLRANGVLVLTFLPKTPAEVPVIDLETGTVKFHPYSGAELAALMDAAGFRYTRIESDPQAGSASNYAVIGIR